MKNKSNQNEKRLANAITSNIIRAHEATGHVTMREHVDKMHRAVQKCVCGDDRFCTPTDSVKADLTAGRYAYKPNPYVVDITTPDSDGTHHAIVSTSKGELVRHGFEYNKEDGTAKMVDGDSVKTERTSVYAKRVEDHEANMIAAQEVISCRASNGVKLTAAEKWVSGESVSFIYVPGGISTISAGFRKGESITCTVNVDEKTAVELQESFDYISATEKQEPYADEDHEGRKATLRFPAGKVKFVYGTHKSEEGIIVKGAEPTSYGAEAVNGKVYASWSPEFATDAEYAKAKCKNKHWTFPDGVRGSASNPARMIAVNFVTGALTNKPAFKNMPPVKAKFADIINEEEIIQSSGNSEGVKKSWETRKFKSPGKIYPAGHAPTFGVYHKDALGQWGERAVAISHHWSKDAADKEASKNDKHIAVEYAPESTTKASQENGDEDLRIVATLFKDDAEREAFAASKPEAAWLRAALCLPVEGPKVEEKKTEEKTEEKIQATAAELEFKAMMERRNSDTQLLSAMASRVPEAEQRGGMEALYARAGVNA